MELGILAGLLVLNLYTLWQVLTIKESIERGTGYQLRKQKRDRRSIYREPVIKR